MVSSKASRCAIALLLASACFSCQTIEPQADALRCDRDSEAKDLDAVIMAQSQAARERVRKRLWWLGEGCRRWPAGMLIDHGLVTGSWWLEHFAHDRDTYFVVEHRNIFVEAELLRRGSAAKEALKKYQDDKRVIVSGPSGYETTVGKFCQNLLKRLGMVAEGKDVETSWQSFFAECYGESYCQEVVRGIEVLPIKLMP